MNTKTLTILNNARTRHRLGLIGDNFYAWLVANALFGKG